MKSLKKLVLPVLSLLVFSVALQACVVRARPRPVYVAPVRVAQPVVVAQPATVIVR
ncbi:MAG: hypothetical protein HY909_06015 [Deltaproteobacteria bacterium]|nr:hypothetical protein [Deltaproteobacteria bacterium]